MKLKINRILTLALVLAMVLSMSISAFASTTGNSPEPPPKALQLTKGSLTVSGDQLGGKTVTIIRMFSASVIDVDNNNLISNGDTISYELEDKWDTFFTDKIASDTSDMTKSEKAAAYIRSKDIAAFAKEAKAWAVQNETTLSGLTTTGTATNSTVETIKDSVVFNNLTPGYYLVYPQSGSTAVSRSTDAMLVNVPSERSANLELKTAYPTVEKKVENSDATTAQIGDPVTFTLTSTVPNMEGYTKYKFVFKDTMSEGLIYTPGSVKVYLGNSTEPLPSTKAANNNYTIGWDGTNRILTVTFEDLTTVEGATPGTQIKVTYSASLTKDAFKTGEELGIGTNSAVVEYSTNPDGTGTGTSTPDITKVYSFPITIEKFYNKNENGATTKINLKDAKFKLTKDSSDAAIELVKEETVEGVDVYHVASTLETGVTKVSEVVTPESGKITIKGLKEGTYKLYELAAPAGYNKLEAPVTIVIDATIAGDTATVTYKVDEEEATNSSIIPVENHTGALLPGTGSIGTIGLTILGVAVVVLAVCLPSRKKKTV